MPEEKEHSDAKKIVIILLALVVISVALVYFAIILGLLVFITSTPNTTFVCSSNQPAKINVITYDLDNAATNGNLGDLVITNVSGGRISSVDIDGDAGLFADHDDTGDFTFDGDDTDSLAIGNSTIAMKAGPSPGNYPSGRITIGYIDSAGLTQSTIIACQGASITLS